MNTHELEIYGRQLSGLSDCFAGVYARDQLQYVSVRNYPMAFVINSDPIKKSGEHWIGVYLTNPELCLYFDSFGLSPWGEIARFCYKYSKRVLFNRLWLQSFLSQYCGIYVLYFLNSAAHGLTMNKMFKDFKSYDWTTNDQRIMDWFINTRK